MKLPKRSLVMDRLIDLVKIYDNAIEKNVCDFLINVFDTLEDKHEKIENDRKPNFTQLNLTEISSDSDEISEIHNYLISKVFEYKKEYYEFIDNRCFPNEHAFEQFRIKKYNNDGNDAFDCHVDVTDYSSARRFLSFMWYLNDVEIGGETVLKDVTLKPEAGKLLVFPSLWMFPHYARPPVSNSKYIVHTYLHYK
jgi:hypothetical protein